MTGNDRVPTTYTLELAGSASPDLNAAFNEFVRPPQRPDGVEAQIGARALVAINFLSYQSVNYHPATQIDRGKYGEGEGVALGRYMKGLDTISRNKLQISSHPDQSGIDGDGAVWFTLAPSVMEREAIVRPPLYRSEDERLNPDLRMHLLIPERYRVGDAAATLALNSLRVKLQHDEYQRREVDASRRSRGRLLFATKLRIHETKHTVPPAITHDTTDQQAA